MGPKIEHCGIPLFKSSIRGKLLLSLFIKNTTCVQYYKGLQATVSDLFYKHQTLCIA